MARKLHFSDGEWELLRDAPHAVAIAVAVSGASGIFGSLKEAMASAGVIVEALKGDNYLLQDICARDAYDSGRRHSPLVVPDGAVVVDTTNLTIDGQVERVLEEARKVIGGGRP